MTYAETLQYLYTQMPAFQQIGDPAYKPGLERIARLCAHMGNPQERFKSIHVAGTNGKGSSAHALAAILQQQGYRVGLHTSPHLHDMRERIRLNGLPVSEAWVVDFVARHRDFFEQLRPSFFEVLVGMAFVYFAEQSVDWAVVEVGLGGRLDATNILQPEICLITHIGFDHERILGDTLQKIAAEKAGIIKAHTPVVMAEKQPEIAHVFQEQARQEQAPIYFAVDHVQLLVQGVGWRLVSPSWEAEFITDLQGSYQRDNLLGVLQVMEVLHETKKIDIQLASITDGLAQVRSLTGLRGRWQVLGQTPLVIADVAHNRSGIQRTLAQLPPHEGPTMIVLGFSADKSLDRILPLFPETARYFFTQFEGARALPAHALADQGAAYGLHGMAYPRAADAYQAALGAVPEQGLVLILGSIFLVALLLPTDENTDLVCSGNV